MLITVGRVGDDGGGGLVSEQRNGEVMKDESRTTKREGAAPCVSSVAFQAPGTCHN